jgi:hypothetical protein
LAGAVALVAVLAVGVLVGCSEPDATLVIRSADAVQVMTPEEVSAGRMPPLTPDVPTTLVVGGATAGTNVAAAPDETVLDTIPLNTDNRPPELKLFDAFGKFRSCLEDKGYAIEGDLLDPNNPAYKDPDYQETVQTCAARTDIVNVLSEVQATRANLTPDEVKVRNEVFTELRTCLEAKGWSVETATSEIGLLEPKVFQNADGVLDERDINQCLSEQHLGDG